MITHAKTLIQQAEADLNHAVFPALEAQCHRHTERVLQAFQKHRVGEEHFYCVTGYGHDDLGRAVVDKVFADALEAERALVRPHIVSGTHALSLALNGCLHHGDTLLSLTGRPYDTLEEVIGIRGRSTQSLNAKGIVYDELNVFEEDANGVECIRETFSETEVQRIQQATMLYFQRSRGYSTRQPMTLDVMSRLIHSVKALNPTAIVMVDNCYGEFLEAHEPTHPSIGADIMAGSLIKNLGGGIVPAGGYIAGRSDLVESVAECLTCPGIGAHGGYMFEQTRTLLQGLFLAPNVVKEAVKGMCLSAHVFDAYGLKVSPHWDAVRSDIIQTLWLETEARQRMFAKVVQQWSPISSYITPVPAHAPGYESQLMMAGGTFIEGSSIELSADGPMRPPYTFYFQGGLVYSHARLVVEKIIEMWDSSEQPCV
jgi:cystathionine beta-lyase family protein involved in aluminum resistance